MVEVTLGGYHYRYENFDNGRGWVGTSGYEGSLFRYSNCVVPTSMWSTLRQEAINAGYSEADFEPPSVEKKAKRTSRRSKPKNSIFIFSGG